MFSALAGLRAALTWRAGLQGWQGWLAGTVILLVCVALLRHWAYYLITSRRVIVRNGYTGRDIDAMELDDLGDVSIQQGPVARFWNIGTLVIRSARRDRQLTLRGLRDPDMVKTRLEATR
jgi:membrane protein YdbS with pleckstrin-like domain